jgi:hypothetical protein
MRIKCGSYEVLDSGLVIAFKDEPIEFILTEGPPPLVVRFLFNDDDGEQRMDGKVESNHEITITLFNFSNQLGSGSSEPIPLGMMADRRLYFNYRIYSLGEKSARTLQYTWYLEEARKDG